VTRTTLVLGTNLGLGVAALAWALVSFGGPALALLARAPSAALLAAFVGAVAAGLAVDALRWRVLLAGLGDAPPLRRLTLFRAAGQSLSSLLPSAKLGGEPLRMYLLTRARVPAGQAIASVAVDRTLELGASTGFACLFALVLLGRGVPELAGAAVTLGLAAVSLGLGALVTVRRLVRGTGLVTALARATGLDRVAFVGGRLAVVADAEGAAARLVAEPARVGCAFAVGIAGNLIVLLEYHLLLAAFALPAGPIAVVAAVFAAGAAHALPVPAAVGALEGGMLWLFGVLGYPPELGLAVGLAVRLRELLWVLPGLLYLLARQLTAASARALGTIGPISAGGAAEAAEMEAPNASVPALTERDGAA
jgi:uncharacterized protein (TIRG00374 family)